MKNLTQIIKEAYAGQPVNTADKKVVKAVDASGKTIWKKVPAKRNITKEEAELEEKRGLWDNIHAKRERIKAGSGERMRKPGSPGAPTAQALKAAAVKEEAEDSYYDEWDEMTRSELKAAINAAKEILDMMDEGIEIERWQLSEITKASESLTDVYINLSADNEYEEDEEDDMEDQPEDDMTSRMEEVELDEGIDSMSSARLKYHAVNNFPHGSYTRKEIQDEHKRRMKVEPNYHAVKPSLSEEVEQIDEISQKLKDRYVQRSMASHQHMSAVARDSGTSEAEKIALRKKMKLRNQGMGRAFGQTKDTM